MRVISYPLPLSIYQNSTALIREFLGREVGPRLSQMQGGILVVPDPNQQHISIQLIQLIYRRVLSKNIAQIMFFRDVIRILPYRSNGPCRVIRSPGSRPFPEHFSDNSHTDSRGDFFIIGRPVLP
ncbi:hypothetical protein D3C80_1864580 [compost metagenome]